MESSRRECSSTTESTMSVLNMDRGGERTGWAADFVGVESVAAEAVVVDVAGSCLRGDNADTDTTDLAGEAAAVAAFCCPLLLSLLATLLVDSSFSASVPAPSGDECDDEGPPVSPTVLAPRTWFSAAPGATPGEAGAVDLAAGALRCNALSFSSNALRSSSHLRRWRATASSKLLMSAEMYSSAGASVASFFGVGSLVFRRPLRLTFFALAGLTSAADGKLKRCGDVIVEASDVEARLAATFLVFRVFLAGRPLAPDGEIVADLADLADTAPTADATDATERAGE